MLRSLLPYLFFFSCFSLSASGEDESAKTEVIFSIITDQKAAPQKALTQHEKAFAETSITNNLREMGLTAHSISWTAQGDLKVVLPALGEAVRQDAIRELTKDKLIRYGHLSLNLVHPQSRKLALKMANDPSPHPVPGYRWVTMTYVDEDDITTKELLLIKKTPVLDSASIIHAQELYGPYEGKLTVKLNKAGANKMFDATKRMTHGVDRLAIILDGKILSAPVVQDSLGAQFEISGMKDAAEAKKIAAALLSPLNHSLKVKSINPPLAK